uniref:Organic solute transporter subunit alpha n=1 Tax=Leptobrachium leishanense TaxID=445787 RepID=A0A8C5LVZ1_9ANUR
MNETENATFQFNPICRSQEAPYTYEVLQSLTPAGVVLYAVITLLALLALLIFLEEANYMYKKIPGRKKPFIIWVNAGAPVIAITSCFGMWIPRSTMFTDFTASIFLSVFIHKFQLMLVSECDGKKEFIKKYGEQKLKISTGPCCCCCVCLPQKDINGRTLFFLKLGTFQFAFLRPVLTFLTIVLWTNNSFPLRSSSPAGPTMWFNLILASSTITALWAIGIMFNLVRPSLTDRNIIPKFAIYQFVVILSQLQTAIINILGSTAVISCAPPLPGQSRASYMNQQLLIIEMFLTTLFCRLLYRRKYDTLSNTDETENLQNNIIDVNGKAMEEKLQYA